MTAHIVVLVTAPSEEEGANIARHLVDNKLAACVNLIKNIRSIYRWQGKIEDDSEVLLVIKTSKASFNHLVQAVKKIHSYSVPEIIALPIIDGSEHYLQWLTQETQLPI